LVDSSFEQKNSKKVLKVSIFTN